MLIWQFLSISRPILSLYIIWRVREIILYFTWYKSLRLGCSMIFHEVAILCFLLLLSIGSYSATATATALLDIKKSSIPAST